MYTFESRVRYSECDRNATLTVTGLINYLQDCSTFQSDSLGATVEHYHDLGMAWFLSSWQIDVMKLPKLEDEIVIGTLPYDFQSLYGMRNFWIDDKAGNRLVAANSVWFLMDLKAGRPVRIPQSEMDTYKCEERIDMNYESRKLNMPTEYEQMDDVVVTIHMLDTNNHVNNGQYIRLAELLFNEYISTHNLTELKDYELSQIRAEYKKQAFEGDVFTPLVHYENGDFYVSLTDGGKNAYCNIIIRTRK